MGTPPTNPLSSPAPPFLLNPKNQDFIDGRSAMPENENPLPILTLKLLGTGFIVALIGCWLYKILLIFKQDHPPAPTWPIVMIAFLAILIIFITYTTIAPIMRGRRFLRPCKVLYGELITCKRVDDDGTIDWRVSYRFHSPMGRMLEGKWTSEGTATRVAERPMPNPGARVAIAYIDDKTHRML
jgi:hypothetical protein